MEQVVGESRQCFHYRGYQVIFHAHAEAARFALTVDGVDVCGCYWSKLGERTYWTCALCGQPLRGKALMVKHVVGMHYPAAYRAAARSATLPQSLYQYDPVVPPVPNDLPPPSLTLLQMWIEGYKGKA